VVREVAYENKLLRRGDDRSTLWERVVLTPCDLALPVGPTIQARWSRCRYVFNVASASHVDRSILEPGEFIQNNVALQTNVLDAARRMPELELFLQMSTDEVYGPAYRDHRHAEWEMIFPSNPYSASKAAQEAIAFSYWRTYDLPIIITNTMNIIGVRQDPEKFLPLVIRRLVNGEKIVVHSSSTGESGSRFYLHADNLADAWLHITRHYTPGPWGSIYESVPRYSAGHSRPARFNVVGEREIRNDELVRVVAGMLPGFLKGVDPDEYAESLIERVDFHSSRPGHDLRYALDGRKIESDLGWTPPIPLEESLRKTVTWYVTNPEWLNL
jgi:dTDP-glucose 4,6-dehydratase